MFSGAQIGDSFGIPNSSALRMLKLELSYFQSKYFQKMLISGAMYFPIIICVLCSSILVAAFNCNTPPLALPLKNNTLADGTAVNFGVHVQLGGQPQGFRITFTRSNSRIRNRKDCNLQGNDTNVSSCWGASGGVYNVDETFQQASDGTWNVTVLDPPPQGATMLQGYDVAVFAGGVRIPGFPFEVWSKRDVLNKSSLGLGPNSSVLRGFAAADTVPSTAMGLFYGSRSQNHGVNGELIIGGYDSARLKGPFTNFTIGANHLNFPCPLQVQLRDVRLNNVNGSHSLFADSGATVPACIDPLQNGFTFTKSMLDIFTSLTKFPDGSASSSSYGSNNIIYPSANEPLIGNLTLTLSNGYQTVIPHHELISQERGSDAEGKYGVVNSSMISPAINNGSVDFGDQVPVLGGVFLSINYLLVDYEQSRFSLAPAVTGPMDPQSRKIITVCSKHTTPASPGKQRTNIGAIAGGVVAGVGLLALCTAILFWRRRRRTIPRHQSRRTSPEQKTSEIYRNESTNLEHQGVMRDSVVTQLDSKALSPATVELADSIRGQELDGGRLGSGNRPSLIHTRTELG